MAQALLYWESAPGIRHVLGFSGGPLAPCLGGVLGRLHLVGENDQAFGRVRPPVQEDVFNADQQVLRDLLVDSEHAGVDDRHVEPGLDRVVKKSGVHRFAHGIVPSE